MSSPKPDYTAFEKKIGHTFRDKNLLTVSLTHSSYANEMKKNYSNERPEFLGDAVLSLVVSDYIYLSTHLPEGDLTKLRASVVCEASLCKFARQIGLGEQLLLGKGEEQTGGADRPSILADAFEALIAAIYLDAGMDAARDFVLPFVEPALENEQNTSFEDYKTQLQEIVQKNPQETLSYVLINESGPDHDKCFEVEVHLNSNVIGHGTGKSKKSAEQMAAKEALRLMGQ